MTPKYFDIHSHLHFPAFSEDIGEVMKRTLDSGTWVVNVGTSKKTSEEAIALAHKYNEGVYATVGLHPIHTDKSHHDESESSGDLIETEFDYEFYKKIALDPKVVAIGECGLDFYHLGEDSKKKQIENFEKHIDLSLDVGKPLMLHIRDAYVEALEILNTKYKIQDTNKPRGNVHFFAGDLEIAKKFLDLGFTLSFTGVITYPKSKKYGASDYEEIIKMIPLDMIMAETDAPYVAPVPHRGERNESLYVINVIKKIAEIKKLPFEEVASVLVKNSLRVFGI
ncbi:MAG: TatD family hydrolase [bacterium]